MSKFALINTFKLSQEQLNEIINKSEIPANKFFFDMYGIKEAIWPEWFKDVCVSVVIDTDCVGLIDFKSKNNDHMSAGEFMHRLVVWCQRNGKKEIYLGMSEVPNVLKYSFDRKENGKYICKCMM